VWWAGKDRGFVQSEHNDALGIYQTHLDEVGRAIEQGDFDGYAQHYAQAHQFETVVGNMSITNPVALRLFFDTLCLQLERHDLPTLDRVCKSAEFINPTTIFGSHQTRLIRQDAIVAESFSARCVLKLWGNRWRLSRMHVPEGAKALPAVVMSRVLSRQKRQGQRG